MKKALFLMVSIMLVVSLYSREKSQTINITTSGLSKDNETYTYQSGGIIGPNGSGIVRIHTGLEISGGSFQMPNDNVGLFESIDITKIEITCNASIISGSVSIYAGTTKYTSNADVWNSSNYMTLIANQSTNGSTSPIEVTGSAFTTLKSWLDDIEFDKKTIWFSLKQSNESTSSITVQSLSIKVYYKYKFKVTVLSDRTYDNTIGTIEGHNISGPYFDEIITEDVNADIIINQEVMYQSQPYVYSKMIITGSGMSSSQINERTKSFPISSYTTINVTFNPGINATLYNKLKYLAGTTSEITGSTIKVTQASQQLGVVTSGSSQRVAKDVSTVYLTQHGVFGEDLSFQGNIKIKHRDWDELLNESKLSRTRIDQTSFSSTAWYHEMRSAQVSATIEGVSANNVVLQFKDPWRYSNGSQPNSWDNYNTSTSNLLGLGNNETVAGVFLGINYDQNSPSNAHYRINAASQNINGIQGHLTNWSATNATIYNPTTLESPVKFNASGAIITANYKASFASSTASAINNSSQRKVARTNGPLTLHLVYESMGSIWYETSTDNGSTWILMNNNQPLGTGQQPSITSIESAYGADAVVIAYQSGAYLKVKCFAKTYLGNTFNYLGEASDISSNLGTITTANPVITNTIISGGNQKIFLVWEGNKQVGLSWVKSLRYWSADMIMNNLDYSGFSSGINGFITDATTSSSNPTVAANPNGGNFQLAWQEGTSAIMFKIVQSNLTQGATLNVSTGNGYDFNYKPSIIATTSYSYPARLSWVAKRYEETGGEELTKTAAGGGEWKYRTMFTDPSTVGTVWTFGDAVSTTNLNVNAGDNGYIVAWSKSNGVNQYTRSSSLGGTIVDFKKSGAVISGKDVQVVPGTSFSDMYGIMLNTQSLPYKFSKSDNVTTMGKEQSSTEIFSGREGVVSNGNAQFYFTLGDVTVDGVNIEFEEKADSVVIDSRELMNQYLITKPFTLNNQSSFLYGVVYGITDSAACADLVSNGSIGYKVQLVNAQTDAVIGEFDNISYSNSNVFQYQNIGYQVNTEGIGNVTVRLKLVVESTVDAQYRLGNKHNTESITSLGKTNARRKQVSYQGSLAVKEFTLSQNYPNPFNPTTTINYALPKAANVSLKVYDVLGKEIITLVSQYQESGRYNVDFDASKMASGMYIYKLKAGDFSETKKMMLIR